MGDVIAPSKFGGNAQTFLQNPGEAMQMVGKGAFLNITGDKISWAERPKRPVAWYQEADQTHPASPDVELWTISQI